MVDWTPWAPGGKAQREANGRITGTLMLSAEAGLRLVSAEIHHDGQFLTCVWEPLELAENASDTPD